MTWGEGKYHNCCTITIHFCHEPLFIPLTSHRAVGQQRVLQASVSETQKHMSRCSLARRTDTERCKMMKVKVKVAIDQAAEGMSIDGLIRVIQQLRCSGRETGRIRGMYDCTTPPLKLKMKR